MSSTLPPRPAKARHCWCRSYLLPEVTDATVFHFPDTRLAGHRQPEHRHRALAPAAGVRQLVCSFRSTKNFPTVCQGFTGFTQDGGAVTRRTRNLKNGFGPMGQDGLRRVLRLPRECLLLAENAARRPSGMLRGENRKSAGRATKPSRLFFDFLAVFTGRRQVVDRYVLHSRAATQKTYKLWPADGLLVLPAGSPCTVATSVAGCRCTGPRRGRWSGPRLPPSGKPLPPPSCRRLHRGRLTISRRTRWHHHRHADFRSCF